MRAQRPPIATAAAVVALGAFAGLVAAGFEHAVIEVGLKRLLDAPLALQAVVPAGGLVVASLVIRHLGRRSSMPAIDDYIISVGRDRTLDYSLAPPRITACAATLASGCALGVEAPAIYAGAAIGSAAARRWTRLRSDALVVGTAAGAIAAVLQLPVVGALVAVELPYRRGIRARQLPYALLGAFPGWLVFRAITQAKRFFPGFDAHVRGRDVLLAMSIGVVASVVARVAGFLFRHAKMRHAHPLFAGACIAVAFVLGRAIAGASVTVGAGAVATGWAATAPGVAAAVAVIGLRLVAGSSALAGGGIGGLFLPLLAVGGLAGGMLDGGHPLAIVLGAAACLATAYRVPWSALALVATVTLSPAATAVGAVAIVVARVVGPGVRATNAQLPSIRRARSLRDR